MSGDVNLAKLVSVLIPSNNISFIGETLESVFCQTYQNLEIVVVLNGSAVKELANLEGTYANKVKFITCSEKGIVPSLNLGIANCNGELIARIDADDLMPPSRIESQVRFLRNNQDVVCVGGQLEYISPGIAHEKHPGYPTNNSRIKHALYRFSAMPHPGMMYRKEEVMSMGGYSSEFPFIEDWELLFRLSKSHKLANLDITVVNYRVHVSQSTSLNAELQQKSIQTFIKSRLKHEFDNFLRNKNIFKNLSNLRRSIAGYLYVSASYTNLGIFRKIHRLIVLILMSLIDPRIAIEYALKKYSRFVA